MLLTGDSRGASSLQRARNDPATGEPPTGDTMAGNAMAGNSVTGATALRDLAWSWVHAVRGTSYLELTADELHDLLTDLAQRSADALRAAPFDLEPGFAIGAALVAARLS